MFSNLAFIAIFKIQFFEIKKTMAHHQLKIAHCTRKKAEKVVNQLQLRHRCVSNNLKSSKSPERIAIRPQSRAVKHSGFDLTHLPWWWQCQFHQKVNQHMYSLFEYTTSGLFFCFYLVIKLAREMHWSKPLCVTALMVMSASQRPSNVRRWEGVI